MTTQAEYPGTPEAQMFARLFEQLDQASEPEMGPLEPEIAPNRCSSLYPGIWVRHDRRCTLESGHEAVDPVHQHLNLLFWHDSSLR